MRNKIFFISVIFIITFSFGFELAEDTKPPRGYWNNTFLKWALMFGWVELVDTKPDIPEHIEVFGDIGFKETEERMLFLDIYRKKNILDPAPLIIFIHGGSWTGGDKIDYLIYLLSYAEKGYTTASLSYRFAQEAKFPAALEDVICGIKWLKANGIEYGIDSSNVALVGGSAGSHLALLAAYTMGGPYNPGNCDNDGASPRVNAVVNFYGPTDLTTKYAISRDETKFFLGLDYKDNPEKYLMASPVNFVTPDDPPTMTFIGTLDELVPINQAEILNKTLIAADVPHNYHRLKGWPHTMDAAVPVNEYAQYYMDKFFSKYLRNVE
jgi:acetyl esterase/lipase